MSARIGRDTILQRAELLLTQADASSRDAATTNELYQGALTLLRLVHGPAGIHEAQLVQAMAVADKAKAGNRSYNLHQFVAPAVKGALRSLKADLEAGLTGSVAMQASGEVLGDFLGLAKVAMAAGGEGEKNVAAVLVAAAFEDAIRRLAAAKAGVSDRPNLEVVVGKLKARAPE